jgi:hypothetical protein
MDLICYVHEGWSPRIRPASPKRDWMDATSQSFAYRCLPLAIANAHGWEIGSPCGFEARWNGGRGLEAIEIRVDAGTKPEQAPVSLFGHGTITFHVEGLIRTSPGWNLWVGAPPNSAKDGIAPLGGVIETDWSPYSFTMNWRFTRPGQWVRWEEDEPFCFFFPVQRGVLEGIEPELRPLADDPALMNAFKRWSASRDAHSEKMRNSRKTKPSDQWQKLYYRGVGPDGEPGPADHESKLRLAPFADRPACPFHAEPEPAARVPEASAPPAAGARPAIFAVAQPSQRSFGGNGFAQERLAYTLRNLAFDAKPLPDAPAPATGIEAIKAQAAEVQAAPARKPDRAIARREWILETIERQRALSPAAGIPRVRGLSSEEFLERFYAASRPVVIEGELDSWPALKRWTPEYLRQAVGSALIEYQGDRDKKATFELQQDSHKRRMPFDQFIDTITRPGAGNNAYITAYNSSANQDALADLGPIDTFLANGDGMMWIGPAGTFTPLHHDLTNNLLAQITGRKKLVLLPPSETRRLANRFHVFSDVHDIEDPRQLKRFPEARDARRFEVEIGAGDLLYLPVGWWHQVRSVEFSVMLTYTNFRWANDAWAEFPRD